MADPALLELQPQTLRAGAQVLARDLGLQVRRGQRWAVIGRNGAGKSTLLRLLAGLPATGRPPIRLQGRPLGDLSPAELACCRSYMAALPHDRFGIAVLDAVMLAQRQPDAQRALDCLRRVDAPQLERRSLLGLSAGERQRVALAQVLAQDTALLLLDEPASFQDPRHQAWLLRLLREQVPRTGQRALVFSAHDVNWVASLATDVLALLPEGRWLAGSAAEVLQADTLQAVYDCAWQRIARSGRGDLWLALD